MSYRTERKKEGVMKVGYTRVSTQDQDESLQKDALEAAGCERFFSDKGTGAKFDRKGLNEALAFMRSGDILVVWKLDRLGRSLIDLIKTLNMLSEKGIGFMSLTEHMDTTSPGGRLLFQISGAFAEFERSIIQERTKAGLTAARARGKKGGRPKKLPTDSKVALARRMHADKNNSIKDICSMLGISRSTLYDYLNLQENKKEEEEEI